MKIRTLPAFVAIASIMLAPAGMTRAAGDKPGLIRIRPVPSNEPIPTLDFFRRSLVRLPILNPSGTHVAALSLSADDQYRLVSIDLATRKFEMLGGTTDQDIYDFYWLGEDRLMFSLSARKLYHVGIFAAKIGRLQQAYPLLQYCGARVVSLGVHEDQQPLIWVYDNYLVNGSDRDEGVAVLNTDLDTGRIIDLMFAGIDMSGIDTVRKTNDRQIERHLPSLQDGVAMGYLADVDGNLAYGFAERNGHRTMYRLDGDSWKRCPVRLRQIEILGPGNKPGQVVALQAGAGEKPAAVRFLDPAAGQFGDILLRDPAYDFVGSIYRDRASHEITGLWLERNGPRPVWFSPAYRDLQDLLNRSFPHLAVHLMSGNKAGNIFLFKTYSDRQPAIYYWIDLPKKKIGIVESTAPWIDPNRMQPMYPIKFTTRDGRKLDAYLTLPHGASRKHPPPLVVLPHGGPWVRDVWRYDGEVQFLASRGYAVLQPNYRGSPGYDWMFPMKDEWDFAKMSEDVTDATKEVIASGNVDGTRVAIMGGSFGGYLAVKGVEDEPNLYRCAVAIDGVFDWRHLIGETKSERFDNPEYDRLVRELGDPKKNEAKFEAISPVLHVDAIRVPVFVAHGKDDPVVSVSEAKALLSQLERYHVPHEEYLAWGEGHGMGHLEHRIELYDRIASFLATNLAPRAGKPLAQSGRSLRDPVRGRRF